jgi:hypothetical protein
LGRVLLHALSHYCCHSLSPSCAVNTAGKMVNV